MSKDKYICLYETKKMYNDNTNPKRIYPNISLVLETDKILYFKTSDLDTGIYPDDTQESVLLYKVGLLSDVHYKDTDETDNYANPDDYITLNDDEYDTDFINALQTFYYDYNVDMICAAGDITSDEVSHMRNFISKRNKWGNGLSIYSCKGNHDNAAINHSDGTKDNDLWKDCSSNYNDGLIKHYCTTDVDNTSFYFIKNGDVYIFLDVDYANNSSSPSTQTYDANTLLWFESVLEDNKDKRCFVFTHLFFGDKAGTYHGDDYFNYYSKQNSYCLIDRTDHPDRSTLDRLYNTYTNTLWFGGHSHYAWYWEAYDENINICDRTIHIPSTSQPLSISTSRTQDNERSEGAIMEVYNDKVIIKGIVFRKSGNAPEPFNEISDDSINLPVDYYDNTTSRSYLKSKYLKAKDMLPDTSRSQYSELQTAIDTDDNYVELTFSDWQMFKIFADHGFAEKCIIDIEDLVVTTNTGVDITDYIVNSYYCGFRTTISADVHNSDASAYVYFLKNDDPEYNYSNVRIEYENYPYLTFGFSSAFTKHTSENNVPQSPFEKYVCETITVKIKCKYRFYRHYSNEFVDYVNHTFNI